MKQEIPTAELIGNEGPVLYPESVNNSLCSVGDNVPPAILVCFCSHDFKACPECLQTKVTPRATLLNLPAQLAQARASKAGSKGDKCKEGSCLPVLDQVSL